MSKLSNSIITANRNSQKKNWLVDLSGEYISIVEKYLLNEGISKDGVNKIISNSAKILGYCPNPNDPAKHRCTGLVIGKVQSGKTSNFIAVTANAFDNGYNIVVILGGTKKNLLKQNKERIQEYFEATQNVVVLNAYEDRELISEGNIRNFISLGKKIIIVTLKHQTSIKYIKDNLVSKSYIKTQPILIIDDEGDEYSLNTKFKKDDESANYKAIKNLRDSCERCAYLSVTATPQANIIIPRIDVLSPDFAILVEPGEGYCGLDVFHDANSQYCIEIKEDENLLDGNVPKSFYDAIDMFFVGAANYHIRSEGEFGKKNNLSMLIHPSRIVNDLSKVAEITKQIVDKMRSFASDPNDISYISFKNRLEKVYNNYKESGANMVPFELIMNNIYNELLDCGIHLITGQNKFNGQDRNYLNNIYIGGDMVGRGLTFKGLMITYIIRSAKGVSNVDTLQQRARWFGYQMYTKNYLDLCRIYATAKIISDFEAIKEHEEDLWKMVEEFNLNGYNFKNMKKIFMLPDSLRPTRTSVGETEKYTFSAWTCENRFIENQEYQKYNLALIDELKDEFKDKIQIDVYGQKDGTKNLTIRNLSYEYVVHKYLNRFHTPINGKIDVNFLEQIIVSVKMQGLDPICDLVWPRYDYLDGKQKIKINEDGIINNYMIGRRPKVIKSEEEIVYKGDKYICRGDVIEIQFHNILNEVTNETSLCMAIFVPNNYRLKKMIVTM